MIYDKCGVHVNFMHIHNNINSARLIEWDAGIIEDLIVILAHCKYRWYLRIFMPQFRPLYSLNFILDA